MFFLWYVASQVPTNGTVSAMAKIVLANLNHSTRFGCTVVSITSEKTSFLLLSTLGSQSPLCPTLMVCKPYFQAAQSPDKAVAIFFLTAVLYFCQFSSSYCPLSLSSLCRLFYLYRRYGSVTENSEKI